MKSIISTLLLLSSVFCFAQNRQNELTKAEQFSLKSGALIERQFIPVGELKTMKVEILKLKDVNSGLAQSALKFSMDGNSKYSTRSSVALLDADEVSDLVRSIKNLQQNIFPTQRQVYTEITFKSKSGFRAGAFFDISKNKWSAYLQLEEHDQDSMLFLALEDFTSLLGLLEKSKLM